MPVSACRSKTYSALIFGRFRATKTVFTTRQLGGIIMDVCVARQRSHSATMEAYAMQGKTKEIWKQLCEQAAAEQDPAKLLELVKQIDRMLDEKETHLLRDSAKARQ